MYYIFPTNQTGVYYDVVNSQYFLVYAQEHAGEDRIDYYFNASGLKYPVVNGAPYKSSSIDALLQGSEYKLRKNTMV